jgi:hypothetical protein
MKHFTVLVVAATKVTNSVNLFCRRAFSFIIFIIYTYPITLSKDENYFTTIIRQNKLYNNVLAFYNLSTIGESYKSD